MFSIVEISNKYVFEDDLIPHSPRGRVAICELCPHIVLVIGKYTDVFREDFFWWRGGGAWEDLFIEKFFMEKENVHDGGAGFPSII